MKSINALIKNIKENPDEWIFTEHLACNTKHGIQIWIANGLTCCGIYNVEDNRCHKLSQWNLFDKIKIWKELKKLPDYLVLKKIK